MDYLTQATLFLELTENQRKLDSDHLIKASSPNSKNLRTGRLDFSEVFNSLENSESSSKKISYSKIKNTIREKIETEPVYKSPEQASVDLSQSYIANTAAIRILNNYYQSQRTITDSFRPI